MLPRRMRDECLSLAQLFPVVALFGPRQAGKTTLARDTFPEHVYVNLEDLEMRSFARDDPKDFLNAHDTGKGVLIDEVQYAPELLSMIQVAVDQQRIPGKYVITGSQNILMNAALSQSLAGRVGILTLLPFTIKELKSSSALQASLARQLYHGMYPSVNADGIPPEKWYPNYIRTYLERDVRNVTQIRDLSAFQDFLALCAGRIGQLLNISELARDCGIHRATVEQWLSVLEASYILFRLKPYHRNFSKRIIKSPKLYFYDTGLAASLLGIKDAQQLHTHYLRGGLFESFVVSELIKRRFNRGLAADCFFWRDKTGLEVDCLIDSDFGLMPVEVKSGATFSGEWIGGLQAFAELSGTPLKNSVVVYGGERSFVRRGVRGLSWHDLDQVESL